jgi:hypothetical protein
VDAGRQHYTVGSFRTARCQARPGSFDEEKLHWKVEGVVVADLAVEDDDDDGPDLILIAELFVHTRQAAAAATVEAMIAYEDRAFARSVADDPAIALNETERTAHELRHVLYDTAADVVRTLATLTRATLEVPGLTPAAQVTLWEPDGNDGGDSERELEESHQSG